MIISDDIGSSHGKNFSGKRDVRVYIARYEYNPYEGPNSCPEVELYLHAGEYVYVSGAADEDGFYIGETTDGRRGLVPGNYLELVPNLNAPPYRLRDSECHQSSVVDATTQDSYSPILSRCIEMFELDGKVIVPFPRQLRVDKRLSHSLLISWLPPRLTGEEQVQEYRIDVNHQLKTIVDGEKSSAVVENIHDSGVYRICVSAVLQDLVKSDPLRCTMLYGNDLDSRIGPLTLKLEAISSLHCSISWIPINSNHRHKIYVNNIEREILPPGFYMARVNDLEPERNYVIQVESIVTVGVGVHTASEKATLKVRTRPPGPPEPPQSPILEDDDMNSKQVLIRWLPVTLTGQSNGTQIRGYCVYQNGKIITEVLDPAGDHVSVLRSQVKPGSKITVKTMTVDGELSNDSGPAKPTQNQLLLQTRNSKAHQHRSQIPSAYDIPDDFRNQGFLIDADRDFDINAPKHAHDQVCSNSLFDLEMRKYQPQRSRIRSVDYEQENADWPRHALLGPPRDWSNSLSRQRARSIPRKMNFNREPIGFLDSINDPIPHGLPCSDEFHTNHLPHQSYETTCIGCLSQSQSISSNFPPLRTSGSHRQRTIRHSQPNVHHHRLIKNSPNIFDRLRDTQLSDFSESGSLSSISSWDRRTPTARIRRQHKPSKTCSLSMNDLNFHQLAVYPGSRGRSPEQQNRPRKKVTRSGLSRLFVALYEYDPVTQSPNEDAADVELSFREGQVIKIYGEKDDDGFFRGAIKGGKRGLVPCNMVAQVDVADDGTLDALYKRGFLNTDNSLIVSKENNGNGIEKTQNVTENTYVAVYDYNPSESSPNIDKDEELELRKGDMVKVLGELDDDGFYYAKVNSRKGYVPSNYLSKIKHETQHSN